MRRTKLLKMAVVGAALAAGCATWVPIKDTDTLLDVEGDSKVAKNGVTVTFTPVDVRNYVSEIGPYTYETYLPVCGQKAEGPVTVYSKTQNVYPMRAAIFEPCCTFKVRIENGTGHTISLAGATIQLEDGAGKSYELLRQDPMRPWPSLNKRLMAASQRGNITMVQAIGQAANQTIPIPGPDAKILPGKTKEFVLPFAATDAAAPLKVMLYDLVTATDAAGNPSVKDNFEYAVALRRAELWRTVNDGTGQVEWTTEEPDPEQCK